MAETTIITRRIKLSIAPATQEEKTNQWNFLRYLDNSIYKMANEIINNQLINLKVSERVILRSEDSSLYIALKKEMETILHEIQFASKEDKITKRANFKEVQSKLKDLTKKYQDQTKDSFGCSIQNTTYQIISKLFDRIPSSIVATLNQTVYAFFKKESLDVFLGKQTARTYKKGMPIPFAKNSILNLKKEGKEFTFNLFNNEKYRLDFKTYLGKDKSNNRIILERVMNNEYEIGDSSIQVKDKDIYLNLIIKLPVEKIELDPNISIGVDLGINTPAYAVCSDGIKRKAIGDRTQLQNKRSYIQKRRRESQRAAVNIKGGKGREKKLSSVENIKLKEKNFVTTYNHMLSSQVVKFAIECKAKTIHLEDLKGFGQKEKQAWVLRNWSYFQLQTMIEQKAKKYDIDVIYIDPAYTSQTCPTCQNVDKQQRLTQKSFICNNDKCKDHGVEKHADFVGGLNISRKKELKVKKEDLVIA